MYNPPGDACSEQMGTAEREDLVTAGKDESLGEERGYYGIWHPPQKKEKDAVEFDPN